MPDEPKVDAGALIEELTNRCALLIRENAVLVVLLRSKGVPLTTVEQPVET